MSAHGNKVMAANIGQSEVVRNISLPLLSTAIECDFKDSSPASVLSLCSKGRQNWKSRQAASIQACLHRQQKEKQRLMQEKQKRASCIQSATRLSLKSAAWHNAELKAWALAHAPAPKSILGHLGSYEVQSQPSPLTMPDTEASLDDVVHKPDQVPVYHRLCGFLPSDQDGISAIFSVLKLAPDDVFYDLGCGDGRIVLSVAKHFRCHGVGVEVNRLLVQKARSRVETDLAGDPELLDKVKFVEDDISNVSLNNARAVFIYMPNSAVQTLVAKVLPHCDLQDGTLICIKDTWIRDPEAVRYCKYISSQWSGGVHCYKWQRTPS
jgi:hypothetical protein